MLVNNLPQVSSRAVADTRAKALVSRYRRPLGAKFFVDYDRNAAPSAPAAQNRQSVRALLPSAKPVGAWSAFEKEVRCDHTRRVDGAPLVARATVPGV
jgi:hypothetical protein